MTEQEQEKNTNTDDTNPTTPTPDKTETQPEQTGADKTFTQADVDRIISDRLKRAEDSIQKKLLESLGVESVDDAKSALEAKRKADEAAMSELEKAQAEIQKANEQAEKARKEAEDIRNQMIANGRRSKFIEAIRNHGGTDESELYILVDASMKDEFDTVFEDGKTEADDSKMTAFVKTVQSKFPKYFGSSGAGNPSTNNGVNPTSKQQAIKDAQEEIDNLF